MCECVNYTLAPAGLGSNRTDWTRVAGCTGQRVKAAVSNPLWLDILTLGLFCVNFGCGFYVTAGMWACSRELQPSKLLSVEIPTEWVVSSLLHGLGPRLHTGHDSKPRLGSGPRLHVAWLAMPHSFESNPIVYCVLQTLSSVLGQPVRYAYAIIQGNCHPGLASSLCTAAVSCVELPSGWSHCMAKPGLA